MPNYQRIKIDASQEMNIVTGMIVSGTFLKRVSQIIKLDLFINQHLKIIARWAMDYYRKYENCPGQTISDIYQAEKEGMDETTQSLIAKTLESLSSRYENQDHFNVDYEMDRAEAYLKDRSLEELSSSINGARIKGNLVGAEALVSNYKRISFPSGQGVSVLEDKQAIIDALTEDNEDEILTFPGDLGQAIGPLCRDDLFAVAAPAKRGKTWWLIWMATSAVIHRLNVLFFSLEMTQKQMIRRIYQSILGETKRFYPDPVQVPYFTEDMEIDQKYHNKKGVNSMSAIRKKNALRALTKGAQLKLICVPAYSMSVSDSEAHIDNLEHFEGFIPDVIVYDYGDILAPEVRGDARAQIDSNWRAMRSLAQKRHCLVLTGTHTGRSTFNRDAEQGDVTEDIRKLNHVAGMIAINQDKQDKEDGCYRVSVLAQRHEEEAPEVTVLSCLKIGRPCLDSRFSKEVKRKK